MSSNYIVVSRPLEKVVEDCYDKYKAQLCYDGHYLYSLCKMLI